MAAGAALAAKRGERSRASLKGASRQMAESMSEDQLEEFAGTKTQEPAQEKAQSVTLIGAQSWAEVGRFILGPRAPNTLFASAPWLR
jgi:Protein of unknwon function (DUF3008).